MANTSATKPQARAAMTRRWARHWLRCCREMPVHAQAVLDRYDDGPARRIHEFRRLMKAWRALLKLAPPGLAEEENAVRAGAARLRRGFGMARDKAVIAKVLGTLAPEQPSQDDAQAVAETLLREQGDAVRAELQRLSGEMEGWSLTDEAGGFLVRAFRRSYRQARRQARRDPRRMKLKRLHGWRTMIVDLGYQLSFFQPADAPRFRQQAEVAERLRAHLGNAIDLDMVRAYLAESPWTGDGERLANEIARRIARHRRKAAKLAERLLERRPVRVGAHLREAMGRHTPRRISLG